MVRNNLGSGIQELVKESAQEPQKREDALFLIGNGKYRLPISALTGKYDYRDGKLNIAGQSIPMNKDTFDMFAENPDDFREWEADSSEYK